MIQKMKGMYSKIIRNIPLKENTLSSQDETERKRIKLSPEQAALDPFPPGCSVAVVDNSRIISTGVVSSVYISFVRDAGSCEYCYEVSYGNPDGMNGSEFVRGSHLRYALNCIVKVSPDYFPTCSKEHIDGVIKGYELSSTPNGSDDEQHCSRFSYTVETIGYVTNGDKMSCRYRGVDPEYIRFCSTLGPQCCVDKPSFDSFEEGIIEKSELAKKHTNSHFLGGSAIVDLGLSVSIVKKHQCIHGELKDKSRMILQHNSLSTDSLIKQDTSANLIKCSGNHSTDFLKCTPMIRPIPTKFQGDVEKSKNATVPEFSSLANFPLSNRQNMTLPCGMKLCVMCGHMRQCSKVYGVNKSKSKSEFRVNMQGLSSTIAVIPNQNKGVCTNCDVIIWIVKRNGLQIKWCKGCKNFKLWAAFGEKSNATKCAHCRERQRDKYAAQKEEKHKSMECQNHAIKRTHSSESWL